MSTPLAGAIDYNYSAIAALTFSIWDICITIDAEVEQIWRGPWTSLKTLHVFLRSFSVLSQIVVTIPWMQVTSDESNYTRKDCMALLAVQGVTSQILELALQYILILRLSALYSGNIPLRRGLRACFVIEIILTMAAFASQLPKVVLGPVCMVESFPIVGVVGYYILPLLFDFVCFILTMIKFYRSWREGWSDSHIVSRFLQDGIWVFALAFVTLLSNLLCMAILQNSLASVVSPWLAAIPGFAGSRLILNMSHLLKYRSNARIDHGHVVSVSVPVWHISEIYEEDPQTHLDRIGSCSNP